MHMLYDSESFSVLHLFAGAQEGESWAHTPSPAIAQTLLESDGFEIVDKRSGKEIFLNGAWANVFQQELQSWQSNGVSEEEIEAVLEQYAELAQYPVLVH